MAREFRVYGPPGTGKTTYLGQAAADAAQRRGSERVVVVSYTRAAAAAAAAEIARRGLSIDKSQIGTVHSLCYRGLDNPPLVETPEGYAAWNKEHPAYRLSGGAIDLDEPSTDMQMETTGDVLFSLYQWFRNRLTPRDIWPLAVRSFALRWEEWKTAQGGIDFCDMIELAYRDIEVPPFSPSVFIVDEAQDLTPLQAALIRKWGAHVDDLVMAGDDDQCLTGDTLISMADGTEMPIRDIVERQLQTSVLSYNVNEEEVEPKKITGWHVVERRGRRLIQMGTLRATQEHLAFTNCWTTQISEWVTAKYERLGFLCGWGAQVLALEHAAGKTTASFQHIPSSRVRARPMKDALVYCIDVEDNHNFFAGNILVHNCLYDFVGATAEVFLNPPLPPEQKRVLAQSYRVPRKVQAKAQRWIEQVTHREPKDYKARDAEGEIRQLPSATWKLPERAIADMEQYLGDGKTIMILTSCSYMLEPVKAVLLKAGIPFHNPYRRKRGDWNPLSAGPRTGVNASQRLLAYLRADYRTWGDDYRFWTPAELGQWLAVIQAEGNLTHGSKAEISRQGNPNAPVAEEDLLRWFEEYALICALGGDLEWFRESLLASKRKVMGFPIRVAECYGGAKLKETPQIIIGTVHSVKGGEADVCYLFPDVSQAGFSNWVRAGPPRDSIIRQFYVGMTRARESLILCAPCGLAVNL